MAKELSENGKRAPAALAMDEAIELAIEGRSPYPGNATFIDAEAAWAGEAIKTAVDEGRAVVLAFADGSTRVLQAAPSAR
jgi:hypothetical protein